MAEMKDSAGTAEKAYAEATSKTNAVVAAPKAVEAKSEAVDAKSKPAPAKKAPVKKVAAKKAVAKKAPAKKVAAKTKPKPASVSAKKATKTPAKKVAAAKKAPAKKPAPQPTKTRSVTELKEQIMATKTADITGMMSKSMNEAVSEMQTKAQEAYDKGTTMVSDMTEVAKGNVEAVVESSKIVAAGMQDMGKIAADEAKTVYETLTADMKEMASVKSPTELFQLQGKIMRRNFDAMVANSSKSTESAMKLTNDAFAPISARVNVAVEKMSKAA